MSATELLKRFSAMASAGEVVDWPVMREEIHAEHELATTEADRVLCLTLHKTLMDFVERTAIGPEKLEKFKETRSQDYSLLLVKEVMIGRTDGNVDPVRMMAITSREIRDGRMSPDDKLHTLAVAGAEILGSPRGLGAKLRSWFK
jgi:hypothetical protein